MHHKQSGSISVQHAIGYRKREAPQGGDGQKAVVSWQVLPMIYRGVGCLSVGAGRQRRRLGLRPPCVEYLGTLGGKSLWGQKAGDASTLADDVPSCGEPWCSPVSLSMLGWPIGRMEPAGRYCLASLYCGGRDTRLHVQGERQLGVQYGLRFLSWARCFGPTVRLARVGRAVRGGRSIGRRELACKGGELSGAPLYPNPTGTNCWSGASIPRVTLSSTTQSAATSREPRTSTAAASSPGPGSAPAQAGLPTSFVRRALHRTAPTMSSGVAGRARTGSCRWVVYCLSKMPLKVRSAA